MSWIQITITMDDVHAQTLGEVLTNCGALSVTFEDAKDMPLFEPLPDEMPLWPETNVIGLFSEDSAVSAIVEELTVRAGSLLEKNFHYKIERIEDKAWERVWMDNFHPMRFGQRLWICPSWCEAPEPEAVNIKLDPGLAFGTGTHPTTALCLEWLDSLDLKGKTIIDFGCGSGILAIAAIKLGATRAIGIDIDSQAIQASRNNAENNDVSERLSLFLPQNIPNDLQADVLVANILSGPLRELSSQICSLVREEGLLCLSGILSHQADSVSSPYAPNFLLDPLVTREEWCRITGLRLTHHPVHETNSNAEDLNRLSLAPRSGCDDKEFGLPRIEG